jgi:preprotein translocase subunit SecY
VLGIAALVIIVTAFVVFVERALRKILVNYAKRQVGNKVYQGQSSHLPLKLNMAGVIPPIFASSIILFPPRSRRGSDRAKGRSGCATSRRRSRRGSRCTRSCTRPRSSSSASSTRRCSTTRRRPRRT